MAPYPIEGRTVLVTGAAQGIGAGVAERLHAAGANVVLVDREAERLELAVRRMGDRAASFVADVREEEQLDRAVAGAVDRFGGVDVAIANAGVGQVGTFADSPQEEIERAIEVNLMGTLRTD